MSTLHLVPNDLRRLYQVNEWRNAAGILHAACRSEWNDIIEVLRKFRLLKSELLAGGGNRSAVTKRLDGAFYARNWRERTFKTAFLVDDRRIESPTHAVDCFKGGVALEVEWSNKDTFFDRDLNNFRLLFELRAIEVGVMVTRSSELLPLTRSFGKIVDESTTHLRKLIPRLEGGSGGGCPVLSFAITPALLVDDGQVEIVQHRRPRRP